MNIQSRVYFNVKMVIINFQSAIVTIFVKDSMVALLILVLDECSSLRADPSFSFEVGW